MTFFTPVYSIMCCSARPTSFNTERQEYWCLLNWPIHHARGRLGGVVKLIGEEVYALFANLYAHGDGSEWGYVL